MTVSVKGTTPKQRCPNVGRKMIFLCKFYTKRLSNSQGNQWLMQSGMLYPLYHCATSLLQLEWVIFQFPSPLVAWCLVFFHESISLERIFTYSEFVHVPRNRIHNINTCYFEMSSTMSLRGENKPFLFYIRRYLETQYNNWAPFMHLNNYLLTHLMCPFVAFKVNNPLSPHDALKHHFTSLKTYLIFLQLRILERKFP